MEFAIVKLLVPAILSFLIGIAITPVVTHYLYKYKAWKKTGGKLALDGLAAAEFNRLKGEGETRTPRMGGTVIWLSVFLTLFILLAGRQLLPNSVFTELDFLSRSQTWVPLAALLIGALIGLLNDFYDIAYGGRGLRLLTRIGIIAVLSGLVGWWFYDKLDVVTIGIPFDGDLTVGWLIVPFFMLMTIGLYASGVIDGIDGLSGGVFGAIFFSYAGIALLQSQFDIAALSATIAGGILAFLWYNIPPARFWMTETGSMALTLTLSVIVFMTDSLGDGHGISLLLIVGFPLIITVGSNIIQVLYKRFTGRKFFRIAPLHHHFEAIGWPSEKVTMRYWVVSMMCATLGILIAALA